jgi:SPP1 gp7 family putative phage head morphogenesis protein
VASGIAGGVGIESAQADDIDDDSRALAQGYHADYMALDAGGRQAAGALVGSPALVTSKAVLASVPYWQSWRDQLTTLALGANESNLSAKLDAWAEQATSDDALSESHIAGSIYESSLQADMGGQLFVRQIEVPEAGGQRANAVAPQANPYFQMTFEEALAYFLERRIVTPEEFARLSDDARMRSFTATRLSSDALIRRCRDLLAQSIANGGTYDDFAAGLRSETLTLGIEPSSPAYVENVYRTNVVGAYGAGRYRQITSDAVRQARPFVEFRAVMDSRTRATHASLNRKVFRQDDPGWGRYAPPLSWQCRCTTVARSAAQISQANVIDSASIEWEPDFNAAPTMDLPADAT